MSTAKGWDPKLYMRYGRQRTQPSIDLVAKIDVVSAPRTIIDVGCGPGNSTQMLRNRWPQAPTVGIDNSSKMIEEARRTYPQGKWVLADASSFVPENSFDVVFSNAALQWIPDHERLIPRLAGWLSERGALAVQIPMFEQMPVAEAVAAVVSSARWSSRLQDAGRSLFRHDRRYYYDLLSNHFEAFDMWETDYLHVMDSHDAIVEWMRSTAIRPYLEELSDDAERSAFESEVRTEVSRRYPVQSDGRVIYAFKRLFFVCYAPGAATNR